MIIYCEVSHFYVNNSSEACATKPTILINKDKIIDFCPSLRSLGISLTTPLKRIKHICPQAKIKTIDFDNYYKNNLDLINFCRQWTDQIEIEYPHAWYCKLPDHFPNHEFGEKFLAFLKNHKLAGTWGASSSKLVAKLATQFKPNSTIHNQQKFLNTLPLECLQIPETPQLHKLGIYSIGELAALPLKDLTYQFGLRANTLKKIANGLDLEPFNPQKFFEISWEINFLTTPLINMSVKLPQLGLFLKEGATSIAQQLQEAQLKAKKIILSWEVNGKTKQIIKNLKPSTNNEKVIQRNLYQALPSYPVEKLRLKGTSLEANVPQQLNILEQNMVNQKVATLKAELSNQLVDLKLTRREKIIEMWDQSYL